MGGALKTADHSAAMASRSVCNSPGATWVGASAPSGSYVFRAASVGGDRLRVASLNAGLGVIVDVTDSGETTAARQMQLGGAGSSIYAPGFLALGTQTGSNNSAVRASGTTQAQTRFQMFRTGFGVASVFVDDGGGLAFGTDGTDGSTLRANIDNTGVFRYGGREVGYRDIPFVTGSAQRGCALRISAGVTVNTAAEGNAFSYYNDSAAAVTLTQGAGLTLRLAGTASTGNRTLAARGFCTVVFNSASEAIVSGNVT